jgi:hypothetical protein
MHSLFVIIPGFGSPHIPEKIAILQNNIRILRQSIWNNLAITIYVYDHTVFQLLPENLLNASEITWIYKQGILGEFIRYANISLIKADYIIILLDDVELQDNCNFEIICSYMEEYRYDILSPSLTLNSQIYYQYMLHADNVLYNIKNVSCCELLCYIMTPEAYQKYYNEIDIVNNIWLAGIDLILTRYLKLRIGLLNDMNMKHHYKNNRQEYTQQQNIGYQSLLNKYQTDTDALAMQKAIISWTILG